MVFDEIFKKEFEKKLKNNKNQFKQASIRLVNENQYSFYRIFINNISTHYEPYKLDLNSALKCIEETISNTDNPTINNRIHDSYHFKDNEICFNLIGKSFPQWGTSEFESHRNGSFRLEFKCYEEFWLDESNIIQYELLSDFESFIDFISSNDKLNDYVNKGLNYNKEAWIIYIDKLLKHFFNEFEFDNLLSSKKKYVYSKKVNNYYLGYELDISFIIKNLNKFQLELPKYINLILIEYDVDKKSKIEKMNLGILGNPFFYPPCIPLGAYQTISMFYQKNNFQNESKVLFPREYIKIDCDNTLIKHPKQFGELLKKQCFYFFSILKLTSKSYIEYIEKSLPTPALVGVPKAQDE